MVPTRTARRKTAALNAGIANAARLLTKVEEDLEEVSAFTYVCIEAIRARDGVSEDILLVLGQAYTRTVLDALPALRRLHDVLKASSKERGK